MQEDRHRGVGAMAEANGLYFGSRMEVTHEELK